MTAIESNLAQDEKARVITISRMLKLRRFLHGPETRASTGLRRIKRGRCDVKITPTSAMSSENLYRKYGSGANGRPRTAMGRD
jgi:hypothetical protein